MLVALATRLGRARRGEGEGESIGKGGSGMLDVLAASKACVGEAAKVE